MFETLKPAPPDSILGLNDAFKQDPQPRKVNLGVGVYKDETGATPILKTVKLAEEKILKTATTKSYMPIAGDPAYGRLVPAIVLGDGHPALAERRVLTAQTPGGTAALRVGADFLKKVTPQATVWVSTPTWANHKGIFAAAGFKLGDYPYYNAATKGLDFDGMKAALSRVAAGDIVVLHACCHNPTGVDLTAAQWNEIAQIAAKAGWIPFVDFAYQGYGDGLESDRAGILALAAAVPELLIASSFSKNFGLYQDRTGAITLIGRDAVSTAAAFSHLEIAIRVNYSNPPAHGGLVVSTILGDPALSAQWKAELNAMRTHIASLRADFVAALKRHGVPGDFSFITRQKGMFSFSGLSDPQVKWLRETRSIYVVAGGRINIAGINHSNLDYLCESVAEAIRLHPA